MDPQTTSPTAPTLGGPVISVGLPVFNGVRFLGQAIESILSQSFADLELIISDNASTDDTRQICEHYIRQDSRIRYFRQNTNVGASRNWNFVVGLARGRFFKWASANDYCDPTMLSKCADILEQDPRVILCYPRTNLVDDSNNPLGIYDGDIAVTDERPSDRYKRIRTRLALNNAQSGLIRVDSLKRTRLERVYPAGDMVLMAELALLGYFWLLPDALFYRRMDKTSASRFLSAVELRQFIDPQSTSNNAFSHWRIHRDHVELIRRSSISALEKLRCAHVVLRHAYWDRPRLWGEARMLFAGTHHVRRSD